MTDETEKIMLDELRHICAATDRIQLDLGGQKVCMSARDFR